jgi:DNA sulfur modification protein DndB
MNKRILLPCLRGTIGNWVTYTCLMRLKEIRDLVSFAEDIHNSKKLSKMIQRELKKDRQKEIGEYLINDTEAFFNALVVAIYNGEPKWHQFDSISRHTVGIEDFETFDYAKECFGYLSLTTEETIFALDGQHRLAGIEYALEQNPDLGFKQLPVTFIPHYSDDKGLKRTRRLFTTLNKKAKPVDKAAIIALDEDDLSASITRRLVEESSVLNERVIKFQANNNIAYSDEEILTTIGNLYDLVKILLSKGFNMKNALITNFREDEEIQNCYFGKIEETFDYMIHSIGELCEFTHSTNKSAVTKKYRRRDDGGLFLFRPLGLKIYILALCEYYKHRRSLEIEFVQAAKEFIDVSTKFEFKLESELLTGRVWNAESKKIIALKAADRDFIIKTYVDIALSAVEPS